MRGESLAVKIPLGVLLSLIGLLVFSACATLEVEKPSGFAI